MLHIMADRIGKDGCHRKDLQFWMSFFRGQVHSIGGENFTDLWNVRQPFQAAAGEYTVGTHDQYLLDPLPNENAAQLVDGSACGNLIVIDQRTFMTAHLVAYQGVDSDLRIGNAFLIPGRDWDPQDSCKTCCRFRLSHIGRDQNGFIQIS